MAIPESVDVAHYNSGERNVGIGKGVSDEHRTEIEALGEDYYKYFSKLSEGKGTSSEAEKKMVHCLKYIGDINGCKIVDYEIPLKDTAQDDN